MRKNWGPRFRNGIANKKNRVKGGILKWNDMNQSASINKAIHIDQKFGKYSMYVEK